MRSITALSLLFISLVGTLLAQAPSGTSSSNYIFSTVNQNTDTGNNSFGKDLNGNSYSMPGVILRGANKQNENSGIYIQPCYPDPSCSYAPIGFDFYFMGTRASEFIINTEGIFGFPTYANLNSNSEINGGCKRIGERDQTPTGAEARIAPFTGWYARTAPSTGQVSYKTIGSAPFRTLVVEWKDIDYRNYPTNPTTDLCSFQLRLYETTNKIEFVYGQMRVGTVETYQVGFSFGTEDGQMATIAGLTTTNPTVSYQSPASATNINTNPINALHSPDGDGKRRLFLFDPYTGTTNTGPANVQAVQTSEGVQLSWSDAPNEIAYDIYWSTDEIVPLDYTSGHASTLSGNTSYAIQSYPVTPAASLTNGSNQVSFGKIQLKNIWLGALLSGDGIEDGTTVTAINYAGNTITISKPAAKDGQSNLTVQLNPDTRHYFKVFARREALSAPALAEIFTGECPPPVAKFTFENTNGLSVQFQNESTSSGISTWNFGDGHSSTVESPEHTYETPGNYTVILTVSDSCGSDTDSSQISLTPTGINTNSTSSSFIYDPVTDELSFDNCTGIVEVYSLDGRLMLKESIALHKRISIHSLSRGIYIVKAGNIPAVKIARH